MFLVRFDANVFVITTEFQQIELGGEKDAVIAYNIDFLSGNEKKLKKFK